MLGPPYSICIATSKTKESLDLLDLVAVLEGKQIGQEGIEPVSCPKNE